MRSTTQATNHACLIGWQHACIAFGPEQGETRRNDYRVGIAPSKERCSHWRSMLFTSSGEWRYTLAFVDAIHKQG
jgi:hypothetical protein